MDQDHRFTADKKSKESIFRMIFESIDVHHMAFDPGPQQFAQVELKLLSLINAADGMHIVNLSPQADEEPGMEHSVVFAQDEVDRAARPSHAFQSDLKGASIRLDP